MAFRRIPSLNWLRVFEAAARTESFARAAEALNMSPPAVSQQIRALEGHLGKPLFERGARHVALTPEGRAFLPAVRRAIGSVETTAAALFAPEAREVLRVQAVFLFTVGWLAARVAEFEAAHPGVRLHLMDANMPEDFRPGLAEVHVTFGAAPEFPDGARSLFGETLAPVACPDVAARIAAPGDLAAQRLIEVSTHRHGWLEYLEAQGIEDLDRLDIAFADNSVTALALAAAGYGVALTRSPATDRLEAAHGLRRVRGCAPLKGGGQFFVFHATPVPGPAARAFCDWLVGAV